MAEIRRPRTNTMNGEIRKSGNEGRSREANKRVTVSKATEIKSDQSQI